MERSANREFIAKVESLVKPLDVTAISFLGDSLRILPRSLQRSMMEKGRGTVPYMGFIVDPYCFFLSYRIKDEAAAASLLPKEYELLPTSLFDGDPTRPSAILSVFTARTSAFIGTRMELYLIARRKSDGSPAWIIVDYATNTNSYDPAKGFCGYDSDPAVFSMSPYGELLVDMAKRAEDERPAERLSLLADISKGSMRALDRTLWVEGNLLVDYGGARHDTSSKAFSLIFDPYLMKEALDLPPAAVEIADNSFLAGILDTESPPHCACFPYSQHFVIRQDLDAGVIKNEADLERHIAAFLADRDFKTIRGSDLKKPILMGMLASGLFTWGLVIFLLIKVLA